MIPFRQATSLFRQSLLVACAHPRYPHSISALRLQPSVRAFSVSSHRLKDNAPTIPAPTHSEHTTDTSASPNAQTSIEFQTQEPRLSMTFTCTVEGCATRSTHEFTKRSYQKGIVIVTCPGCKNRWAPFSDIRQHHSPNRLCLLQTSHRRPFGLVQREH